MKDNHRNEVSMKIEKKDRAVIRGIALKERRTMKAVVSLAIEFYLLRQSENTAKVS